MAQVILTDRVPSIINDLSADEKLWVYNGYDCLLPHEVLEKLLAQLVPETQTIYDFERNLCAVAITMMRRGVLVDKTELNSKLEELRVRHLRISRYVQRLATVIWGTGLNVNSPDQMKRFFYELPGHESLGFGFAPIYAKGKGPHRVTCDRQALEKLETYYHARPVVKAITSLKDIESDQKALRRGIDFDGRMRCSFNVGATETGRFSSSKNPWGGGANFQNLTDRLRTIFVPDSGFKFGYPDLKSAESFGVAYYSNDQNYISACESGSIHTAVSRMVWPNLQWTGDEKADREIASQPVYRHFSYYDLAKRGGHASNYMVNAGTLASHLQLERGVAEHFQDSYFSAFSEIPKWHARVQAELEAKGCLTTPLGRKRTFFGRRNDPHTLKEAVAYLPQSLISDILKVGLLRVFREFDQGSDEADVQVLADMHDGALLMIRTEKIPLLVPKILSLMSIPILFPSGKTLTIPVDFDVGYRWTKDKESGSKMAPWNSEEASLQEPPDYEDNILEWRL